MKIKNFLLFYLGLIIFTGVKGYVVEERLFDSLHKHNVGPSSPQMLPEKNESSKVLLIQDTNTLNQLLQQDARLIILKIDGAVKSPIVASFFQQLAQEQLYQDKVIFAALEEIGPWSLQFLLPILTSFGTSIHLVQKRILPTFLFFLAQGSQVFIDLFSPQQEQLTKDFFHHMISTHLPQGEE